MNVCTYIFFPMSGATELTEFLLLSMLPRFGLVYIRVNVCVIPSFLEPIT
jgi:hypothetical protein